jgi:hypothetical protein
MNFHFGLLFISRDDFFGSPLSDFTLMMMNPYKTYQFELGREEQKESHINIQKQTIRTCQKVTYTLKPSLVANEGKVRNLKKH